MTTQTINSSTSPTATTVLVTGANKGLGRETARQLAALGWTVLLGARDAHLGQTVADELSADGADVRFVHLDVTSDDSVATAVEQITDEVGRLDVLVNNAGIIGANTSVANTRPADFLACFGVNLLGPVRVTNACIPLLTKAELPRVVMVSSGLGSLSVTADPERIEYTINSLVYPSSKAALNMVTTQYAKALPGWKINAVDPGYTATDLNGHTGHKTIPQGAAVIVELATVPADGPTGGFFDDAGVVAW